jgi:hypothetical protein
MGRFQALSKGFRARGQREERGVRPKCVVQTGIAVLVFDMENV